MSAYTIGTVAPKTSVNDVYSPSMPWNLNVPKQEVPTFQVTSDLQTNIVTDTASEYFKVSMANAKLTYYGENLLSWQFLIEAAVDFNVYPLNNSMIYMNLSRGTDYSVRPVTGTYYDYTLFPDYTFVCTYYHRWLYSDESVYATKDYTDFIYNYNLALEKN